MAASSADETGDEPVSRAYLAQVRAEVGDTTLRRYAQAYLELLPVRLGRIDRAIAGEDADTARQVIFELQVSSEMLGTRRLAAILAALERSLQAGLAPSTVQFARARTEAELVAGLVRAAVEGEGFGLPGAGGAGRGGAGRAHGPGEPNR